MIIPSIDISEGRAVQLVEGERLALQAGDPTPIFERFSIVGEVAVVDVDAARGTGDNAGLIAGLCRLGRIRVGGGIRSADAALGWLDRGADKVVIGTAADPALLARLPKQRVVVALDNRGGRVLSHGWREVTDHDLLTRVEQLRELCGGFLVTFVEREGHLDGTDLELAAAVVEAAGSTPVTIAGGITTSEEVAELDRLGADSQVGMALYTGRLSLGSALTALMSSDRSDGLWPTVVTDEHGVALGLAYSDEASLESALQTRSGVYHSRSRGLWVKGQTSGAAQELVGVSVDCDRDTLRFSVRQTAGFCHTGERTCWGEDDGLHRLERRLTEVASTTDSESNTQKLLAEPELLAAKLVEEAKELAEVESPDRVTGEAADLLYFLLAKLVSAGVSLHDVETELDRRELRVSRRPMTRKVRS